MRNELLRRVDWRFLLPDASPEDTLCLGGGELTRAARLISRKVSTTEAPENGSCDLAIGTSPDTATLRSLWRALRPGGTCYTEWRGIETGGVRGVQQRLKRMSFEPVTCFSPWPRLNQGLPLAWVPLEAREPLRYLLGSADPEATWSERLASRLRRLRWIVQTRLGVGAPICIIARKPFEMAGRRCGGGPSAKRDFLEEIRLGWEEWNLGPRPAALSWLLLTGGRRSVNKVVCLVFAGSGPPRVVVKMPRTPESAAGLAHEAEMLRGLQSTGREIQGVPKLLLTVAQGSQFTTVTTALNGVPLPTRLCRKSYREVALLGTEWLVALAGHGPMLPVATWRDRLVGSTVENFEAMFGTVVDPKLMRESNAALDTLGSLPNLWEQRDFAPWNLLITPQQQLQVLDWESAEPQGLPLMDLVYYTSYLAFYLAGTRVSGRYRECYRETLEPGTFVGAVTRECQELYATRLGIPLAKMVPLRLLCWMLHSRSEYRRLVADAGAVPEPGNCARACFWVCGRKSSVLHCNQVRHGELGPALLILATLQAVPLK